MGCSTLGLVCSFLLFSILPHSASGTQRCSPRAMPDMVIDISRAVARGARFTDPLKVSNVEECLSACCRQLSAGGDRACNLLVFDARTPGLHKCYIFHCPSLDSCPLSSSPGVISYSFLSDTSRPGKHDPGKEQQRPQSGDRRKAQGSPEKTSSSGDEKTSGSGDEKTSSSGDEKTSSSGDEKTSSSGDEKTSSSGDEKTSGSGDEKTSSSGDEKTSSSGDEKTSGSRDEKTSSSGDEKTSGSRDEKTSSSGDEKTSGSGDEKTSSLGDEESSPTDLNRKTSSVIDSQLSAEEGRGDTAKIITSQLIHLADKIDQHLEKMESTSKDDLRAPSSASAIAPAIQTTPVHKEKKKLPPNPKTAKVDKVKYKKPEATQTHRPIAATQAASATPKRTTAGLITAARHHVPPTNASHVVPPAAIHNVSGISNVSSSKLPASDHTEVPARPTTHQTRPTHPAPSWTSPWNGVKLSTKSNDQPSTEDKGETPRRVRPKSRPPAQEEPAVNLKEAPGKVAGAGSEGAFPLPGDKSGLVAALVFGVLFLMVVIGLVSHKVSEMRRRHRYSKLDYLINGMYVDT
ncbi:MANSC domain-containing protein 1 [Dendrobates tinctorius]|uniref:MANSC domain-containing protein 1 n=1 Tax=Dendrobates tinctorius TaxID=92724 RepID=UPI003CC928BD